MGKCHEIFDPRFFLSINQPVGPKAVSHMASNLPRYSFEMVSFREFNETTDSLKKTSKTIFFLIKVVFNT
jgi:hypothetical protein